MQFALSDIDYNNRPAEEYLRDRVIGQLRYSKQFSTAMNIWDMVLPPARRTHTELQHMIKDYIQRTHERSVSLQTQACA